MGKILKDIILCSNINCKTHIHKFNDKYFTVIENNCDATDCFAIREETFCSLDCLRESIGQ